MLRLRGGERRDGGHPAEAQVAHDEVVGQHGVAPVAQHDGVALRRAHPAKAGVLPKGQREHLHLYVAAGQVGRELAGKQEGVRKFFRLFWPMLLGISVTQINQVVIKRFGSGLGDSVLSAMGNATTITELPVTLFGATISLAVFPAMSQHYASGQVDEYKKDLSLSMRTMMFITIPASAGLMAIREPLIRALYRQGMFTEENVHAVSVLMIFYIIGIVGYCCRSVFSRGFYAINETKVPVRINITILTLNIILSMIFVKFWKAKGLALAYSVAGLCSMTLLGFFLKRRIGNMRGREMFVSFIKSLIGSCVMFIALIPIRNYLMDVMPPDRKLIQIAHVAILITIGAIIYAVMALILRMQEVSAVTDFMKKKFKKKKA